MAEELDKGETILSKDVYNFIKTKDGKFVSIGNLEPKFQDNMNKVLVKIIQEDKNENGNINEEDDHDKSTKKFEYSLDKVNEIFSNHNRDELFVKFYNTETCFTPVLTLEEAINFQKNLNKSIILNSRMKNEKKLQCLKQIEEFLFTDLKNNIIVDFNAKIYVNHKNNNGENEFTPKF